MTHRLDTGQDLEDIEGNLVTDPDQRYTLFEMLADAPLQALREERTRLLAETDWVVTKYAERGEPVPQEWQDYRQALRDITENCNHINEVTWPTNPA